VGVILATLAPAPVAASEYAVDAQTIVQGYELRSIRIAGVPLVLSRRRFTQQLALDIFDIGDLRAKRKRHRGPVVSFTSFLRVDHDFGDWTMGELGVDGRVIDAVDGIPELTSSSLALDLMYAYVSVDGLADGAVDLRVGRQIELDQLDAWAYDGAKVRIHAPGPIAVEVAGGLRVRDASPLGPAVYELDGTAGGRCREFVEGASPEDGRWAIIDRSRVPGTSPFTSDLDYCPQREQLMPTFGVAVETAGLRKLHARLSYRRSVSPTVRRIGEVDRLDFPDEGLYPNHPRKWGTDEERVGAVVSGLIERGPVMIVPWAGARWSLLHGLVDEAMVGVKVRRGAHAITPEVARSVPTFDGDSIFNVFAHEPSIDARVTWSYGQRATAVQARAGAWVRRYELGDAAGTMDADPAALAGGVTAGAQWQRDDLTLKLDAVLDGGYGGRRAGGVAQLRWQQRRGAEYGARVGVLVLGPDDGASELVDLSTVSGHVALGGTWKVADGAVLHVVAEEASSAEIPSQLRLLGVLDLAWRPER